jgi:hypothetical protein
MAKGDIYTVYGETVADDATLTIQPAAGRECQIHNIFWTAGGTDDTKIEIYRYENSTARKIADNGGWSALGYAPNSIPVFFLVKNTSYLIIKNVSGGSMAMVGCDGVERKPAT